MNDGALRAVKKLYIRLYAARDTSLLLILTKWSTCVFLSVYVVTRTEFDDKADFPYGNVKVPINMQHLSSGRAIASPSNETSIAQPYSQPSCSHDDFSIFSSKIPQVHSLKQFMRSTKTHTDGIRNSMSTNKE
jgi:hypothetical protein